MSEKLDLMDLFSDRRVFWVSIVVVLFVSYFIGVSIRLQPVERWGVYLTGDDPLIHYRNTLSVVEDGDLIRNDSLAWQPRGIDWKTHLPNFHYYLAGGLFEAVDGLGLDIPVPEPSRGILPSEEEVYGFCVLFPAFFAPLVVFPMFFLGRVLWDWRAGVIASVLIAVIPGYMSRTVAGFYRHEQIAIPLMIMSLLFFFLAVREDRRFRCLAYAVVSGLFMFLFAGTWAGFKFLMAVFPVAAAVCILIRRVDFSFVLAYSVSLGIGVSSFFLWTHLATGRVGGLEFAVPFVSILGVVVYWFWARDKFTHVSAIVVVGILALVSLLVLSSVGLADLPIGRLRIFIDPGVEPEAGQAEFTVREHSENSWGYTDRKNKVGGAAGSYGWLRWSVFLVFVPLLWRHRISDVFLMVMCVLGVYFFLKMVRLDVLLSPFVVLASGVCASSFVDSIRYNSWSRIGSAVGVRYDDGSGKGKKSSRKSRSSRMSRKKDKSSGDASGGNGFDFEGFLRFVKIVVLIAVLFFAYRAYVGGAGVGRSASLGIGSEWWNATSWLSENTGPDDIAMSWWDYGYWIQVYAHRPTVADGATVRNLTPLARAFIEDESVASRFCERKNVSYVVVDLAQDVIYGKWTAMSFIARVDPSKIATFKDGRLNTLKSKGERSTIMRLVSNPVFGMNMSLQNFSIAHYSPSKQVGIWEFLPNVGGSS